MNERRHLTVFPGFRQMAERRHSVSGQLTALRRELGLSQAEVASRMGTSQSAVARFEAGDLDARLSTVERYSTSLGARLNGGSTMGEQYPGPEYLIESLSETLSESLTRRLLDQRVVLLHGPLDDPSATRVAAELMTLDAQGDDPVTLRIDCGDAPLPPALTLMDVIDLMGVPVRALCLGQVGGGAVGIVAVCAPGPPCPSTGSPSRSRPPAGDPGATWPSGSSCGPTSGTLLRAVGRGFGPAATWSTEDMSRGCS